MTGTLPANDATWDADARRYAHPPSSPATTPPSAGVAQRKVPMSALGVTRRYPSSSSFVAAAKPHFPRGLDERFAFPPGRHCRQQRRAAYRRMRRNAGASKSSPAPLSPTALDGTSCTDEGTYNSAPSSAVNKIVTFGLYRCRSVRSRVVSWQLRALGRSYPQAALASPC